MRPLELERVVKRYGAVVAIDGLDLALEPSSTVALLGPNGAGKSTMLALALGLRRPDAGRVRLFGGDPREPRRRACVGYAPQEVGFPPTLLVREIADLVARHFEQAGRVADVLEAFGVRELARRQVGGLSGGQRRRLAVALAFLGRPGLVVLDEPTAGLDAEGRRAVWAAIDAARRRDGCVLVATHDLAEAEAVASRVVAVSAGRLAGDGTVGEITRGAGRVRISFRTPAAALPDWLRPATRVDGRTVVEAEEAGAIVARLVHAGVPLDDLEVRPLDLGEALARLVEERA